MVCVQLLASCTTLGGRHQFPQAIAAQTATKDIPVLVTGSGHGVPVLRGFLKGAMVVMELQMSWTAVVVCRQLRVAPYPELSL